MIISAHTFFLEKPLIISRNKSFNAFALFLHRWRPRKQKEQKRIRGSNEEQKKRTAQLASQPLALEMDIGYSSGITGVIR